MLDIAEYAVLNHFEGVRVERAVVPLVANR
jgi:hypothetical protein